MFLTGPCYICIRAMAGRRVRLLFPSSSNPFGPRKRNFLKTQIDSGGEDGERSRRSVRPTEVGGAIFWPFGRWPFLSSSGTELRYDLSRSVDRLNQNNLHTCLFTFFAPRQFCLPNSNQDILRLQINGDGKFTIPVYSGIICTGNTFYRINSISSLNPVEATRTI